MSEPTESQSTMPPCGRCGTPEAEHGEECERLVMPTRGQIAMAIADGWYAQKNPFRIADDILALESRAVDAASASEAERRDIVTQALLAGFAYDGGALWADRVEDIATVAIRALARQP